ncbi:MAG TPA: TolC family protein [Chthoniobacteraceae bacterium]|jgi:multidrug efflux system outer membrane protein
MSHFQRPPSFVVAGVLFAALGSNPICSHAAGEDSAAPPVNAPAHFKNAPSKARASESAARVFTNVDAWWKIFHDGGLDDLEKSALAANQDLRQAVARVDEARGEARIAAADFYPHLDGSYQASRQRTTNTGPVQRGRFVGGIATGETPLGPAAAGSSTFTSFLTRPVLSQPLSSTFNDFRTPLRLTYEVDVFGRIRSTYAQARATAQASDADRRAVELSVSAQVAEGYFNLRALDAQIMILRRTAVLREDARHLQEERLRLGAGNDSDVARAGVELANTQSDLTDALRQRAEAENNLAALCGAMASDFRVAPHPLDDQVPPKIPVGVPGKLLAQRPDLQEAGRKIEAAASGVRVARAELLPTFDIEGDGGYDTAKASELTDWQSRTWEILATVKVPIFEGGKNVANLSAAKAKRDEAVAAYQETVVTAFKEVENALADLEQRAAQTAARATAETESQRVLENSQERYTNGATTYFEVVDAQRDLLGAELRRVETLAARYAATVELVRALGGGWWESR